MNKVILLLAALMLLSGCAGGPSSPAAAAVPCPFYDAALVGSHLSSAAAMEEAGALLGVIVPHHAPFMQLTADVLAGVQRDVETVVVISPDHAVTGEAVQVSGCGYYWADGNVAGDAALAAALLAEERHGAVEAGDVLTSDHGASVQMPYIHASFPEARVVTVFLSPSVSQEQLGALADSLLAAEREVLVLASIDFSHGQSPERQRVCDDETREAVLRGDHRRIRELGNAHLDAPQVLSLMVRLAQLRDTALTELAYVSDAFPENGTIEGASYFVWGLA